MDWYCFTIGHVEYALQDPRDAVALLGIVQRMRPIEAHRYSHPRVFSSIKDRILDTVTLCEVEEPPAETWSEAPGNVFTEATHAVMTGAADDTVTIINSGVAKTRARREDDDRIGDPIPF